MIYLVTPIQISPNGRVNRSASCTRIARTYYEVHQIMTDPKYRLLLAVKPGVIKSFEYTAVYDHDMGRRELWALNEHYRQQNGRYCSNIEKLKAELNEVFKDSES